MSQLWTAEEVDFLVSNKDRMSLRDIALAIGRTESGCEHKMWALRLKKKRCSYATTDPWDEAVFEDHPGADRVGRKVFIPIRKRLTRAA